MKRVLSTIMLAATFALSVGAQDFAAKDIALFRDSSLTELKSVKAKKIAKLQSPLLKDVATQMAEGTYPLAERVRTYRSYLSPYVLAKQLKTSPYSAYENPTGIYFESGTEAVLWVGDTHGVKAELVVHKWGQEGKKKREEVFPLKQGYNAFQVKIGGNSYLRYFTETAQPVQEVKVHILTGKVNGYFDIACHNDQDWDRLLASAVSPVYDIVGRKVHLVYPVDVLKEASGKGVELVQLYDSLISLQHRMMGLEKYNRIPDNHMFARVAWGGFMFADGMGAGFGEGVLKELVKPERLRKTSSWGVSHEFGHVNQVRPDMKWVGTTEVTNNLYSVWAQYLYNKELPKLETEKLYDYDGPKIGGRITAYMESAFVHRQQWLTQAGNDRWDRHRPRDWGGDHFVKLVPLWQLQLYFAVAGEGQEWGTPDFYPDIFIKAIDTPEGKHPDCYYQLNFMRNACDAAKLDLTDFFEWSGMLMPIDLWVDDYSCAQMTITEADISELKQYASRYKKPQTPVLHYITANSVEVYKHKLPLKGTTGRGFQREEKRLIVDNSLWQNAVAFETYEGDKLVKVAFVGAGCTDLKTTTVQLTEGTTAVKAVGQDGVRIQVL